MKAVSDEIYLAAKENKLEKLESLKSLHGTVDIITVEYNPPPVFQLAKEGHLAAVKLLLKLGASKHWAVKGLAELGDFKFTQELLDKGADKDWAIEGAIFGKHDDFAWQLVLKGANKDVAAFHAAHIGNYKLVTKLIDYGASKIQVVLGATLSKSFDKERVELNKIFFTQGFELQKEFVLEVMKKKCSMPNKMNALLIEANKIVKIMAEDQLSYQQASAWIKLKDLRNIIFTFRDKLPTLVYVSLANGIIAQHYLSTKDLEELRIKQCFKVLKKALLSELDCISPWSRNLVATSFNLTLYSIKTVEELKNKINNEKTMLELSQKISSSRSSTITNFFRTSTFQITGYLTGYQDYKTVIDKYYKRLNLDSQNQIQPSSK